MILTEETSIKVEQHDYCICDEYSNIYKPAETSSVFPPIVYHNQNVKLEPLEVKLEPISCSKCSTTIYTHDTDDIQLVGGEVSVPRIPWTTHSTSALMDHLARSVKVCHLPSDVHQESLRGVMSMGGPVITIQYIHQTGQHMQFWICEYQTESDVPIACKKLNAFRCHGVELTVKPALQNKKQLKSLLELHDDVIKPENLVCQICKVSYGTSEDLYIHLYINHHMHPVTKSSLTISGKLSKERQYSKLTEVELKSQKLPKFNSKEWVEKRPARNPDYVDPNDYVLDTVIGIKDNNNKLGFIPVDHMYAAVPEIVRGMIPNSILNGADAITFHPSMVTLIQQRDDKLRYTPVEHSYSKIDPKYIWCSVCGRMYSSVDLLNAHLPVHFKKKSERTKEENESMSRKRKLKRAPKDETFTCKMCSSEFKSKSTFIAHVTAHEHDEEMEVEPKIVTHTCQHCDLMFPSDVKMIKHQLLHECEKCSETFACLSEAQSHRDSHILLEKAKCLCEICGKKFMTPKEFLHHLLSINHPVTKQARRILSIPKQGDYYQDFKLLCRKGDYNCMKCSKTCETDIELYSHMGFHFVYKTMPSPYRIEKEKEASSITPESSPEKTERPPIKMKIQLATILGDISPQKNTTSQKEPTVKLNSFESAVDAEDKNKHACTICKRAFSSKKGLKCHMNHHKSELLKETESEEKAIGNKKVKKVPSIEKSQKFRCMRCIMSFDTEEKLKIHIDAFHEINADDLIDVISKPLPSTKLGKARKSSVKLYRCDDCDKRFAHDFALKAHKETEHVEIVMRARQTSLEEVLNDVTNQLKSEEVADEIDDTAQVSLKEVLKDARSPSPETSSSENEESPVKPSKPSNLHAILGDHKNDSDSAESLITPLRKRARAVARMMKSPPAHMEKQNVRARKTAAKLFKCKICDIRFGSKRILSFHKQQHAEGKIKVPSVKPDIAVSELTQPEEDIKSPDRTKARVSGLGSILKDHIVPENTNAKDVQNTEAGQDDEAEEDVRRPVHKSRKVAKKTIIKKVFECDICEQLFLNRNQYISHIKSHTNDAVETSSISNSIDDVDPDDDIMSSPDHKDHAEENVLKSVEQDCMIPTTQLTNEINIMPSPSDFHQDDGMDSLFEDHESQNSVTLYETVQDQAEMEAMSSKSSEQQIFLAPPSPYMEETKTCNICKKQFLAWSTICAHMGTHPEASYKDVTVDWKSKFNPLFPCFMCGEKYHAVAHCYLHYKYHVNEATRQPQGSVEEGEITVGDLKCTVCGVKYDKVGSLHTHLKMHVPRVGFDDPTQKVSDNTHILCKVCHRVVTPKSRRRHYEIHDEALNHVCEVCENEFPNQREYINHYYEKHYHEFDERLKLTASANTNGRRLAGASVVLEGGEQLQCTHCRSTFLSAKSKRNHEYKHKKGIFKMPCGKCQLFFQSTEDLLYHVDKEGHVQGNNAIPCSQCDYKFLSIPSKLYHEKTVHNLQIELPEFSSAQEPPPLRGPLPPTLSGPLPSDLSLSQPQFRSVHPAHMVNQEQHQLHQQHQSQQPPAQHSAYYLEPLAKHLQLQNQMQQAQIDEQNRPVRATESRGPSHTCMVCQKSFPTMKQYDLHKETECGASSHKENTEFNVHSDYKVVVKWDKNYEKVLEEFSCTICDLTFKSYSERWLHEEDSEKVGNYRCMDCGLDYKTKHQRKKHECNAKLPGADTVAENKHENIKGLPVIGFKDRKCHACNKFFEDKESFKYHVRKHWYRCFSCHYDFCSKKSMRAHLKLQKCFHPNVDQLDTIFDEVFIECLLCNEVLSISDHIGIHFLDHTIKENGKYDMFLCLMCGAPYKIMDQLRHHMKTEGFFMLSRMFPKLKSMNSSNGVTELKLENFATRDNQKFFAGEGENTSISNSWGCPFCSNKYNNYKSAWSHIRSYHKSVGKPFKLEPDSTNEQKASTAQTPKSNSHGKPKNSVGKNSVGKDPKIKIIIPEIPIAVNETSVTPVVNGENSGAADEVPAPPNKTIELNKARLLLSELLNKTPKSSPSKPNHTANHANPIACAYTPTNQGQATRSRQGSESSTPRSPANNNKHQKSPVADYNAAKTAGFIAQMLRGPGNNNAGTALLRTPPTKPSLKPATPLYRQGEPVQKQGYTLQGRNFNNHNNPRPHYSNDTFDQRPAFLQNRIEPPYARHYTPRPRNKRMRVDPPHAQRSKFRPRHPWHHGYTGDYDEEDDTEPDNHYNNNNNEMYRYNNEYDEGQGQYDDGQYHRDIPPSRPSSSLYSNSEVYQYANEYDPRDNQYEHEAPESEGYDHYTNEYDYDDRPRTNHYDEHPSTNDYEHPSTNEYEHPRASDDVSCRSEISSRPSNPGIKNEVHKCRYCQRIFKNYINVYNHLVRNHVDDVQRKGPIRPISRFDGRASVWSLENS